MKRRSIIISALVLSLLLLGSCGKGPGQVEHIGSENAKTLALKDAGLNLKQASFSGADMSSRDGVDYYEVVFSAEGKEYRYDIDAVTGVVIDSKESGSRDILPASPVSKLLTEEEARSKALEHAGLKAADVKFVECQLEKDDGRSVYDIEFYSENKEYDYEIDALTGQILDVDYDAERYAPADKPATPTTSKELLTEEQAKSKALEHAGVKAADVKFVECQLEKDDGRSVYDIEFYSENKEYDYEIDALTGQILDVDYDAERYAPADKPATPTTSKELLTEEQAKSKALAHAGLKASDVKFVKCKLDRDDRKSVYDVEFYSGSAEYDYELDAYTGKILEFDRDVEGFSPAPESSSKAAISADEIKKLALEQVPGAALKDIRSFETDRDDGRLEYEITVIFKEMEYEFEIDGYSGAILSRDVESVYD